MSTYEIYSYWDTNMFHKVFQGVAHFFNDGSFTELIAIGFTFGLILSLLNSFLIGRGSPADSVKYILGGFLMFMILALPKSNVTIIDKSYISNHSAPMTISGVPTVLAYMGHLSSLAGVWMDETYGQYFGLPSEMQAAGTHMTRKVLLSSLMAEPTNALFLRNMTEFARECVAHDITTGYLDVEYLRNAKNFWGALNDTNPALFATYGIRVGKSIETEVFDCPTLYHKLSIDIELVGNDLMSRTARSTFPGMDVATAEVTFAALATESMAAFMGNTTDSASAVFKDTAAQNAFLKSIGAITGDPVATTRASIGIEAGASQKAELAKSFIYTITIVQLLAYAFFPIIVIMAVIAGPAGFKPLMFMVKVLFWLALLQASQVILDSLILMNASKESLLLLNAQPGAVGGPVYDGGSMNAWDNTAGIINGMEDQLQNALFASLALTWGMMAAGGSIGSGLASGLFGGAQTYSERTGIDTAAEGRNTFGDAAWNNKRFHNTQGFDYNTAINMAASNATLENMDGSKTTITGSGTSSASVLGNTGAGFGAKITDSDVATAGKVRQEQQENARTVAVAHEASQGRTRDEMWQNMRNEAFDSAYKKTTGHSKTAADKKAWDNVSELAGLIQAETGVDTATAVKLSVAAYQNASVGIKTPFVGAEAGLRGEQALAAEKKINEKIAEQQAERNADSYKKIAEFVETANKDVGATIGYMGAQNISGSLTISANETERLAERSEAARKLAESYAEREERLKQLSKMTEQELTNTMPEGKYREIQELFRAGKDAEAKEMLLNYFQGTANPSNPDLKSVNGPTPITPNSYFADANAVKVGYGGGLGKEEAIALQQAQLELELKREGKEANAHAGYVKINNKAVRTASDVEDNMSGRDPVIPEGTKGAKEQADGRNFASRNMVDNLQTYNHKK